MRNFKRALQIITFIHRIHHTTYSYGWKIPFLDYGVFFWYKKRWKNVSLINKLGRDNNGVKRYHNCTITGVY